MTGFNVDFSNILIDVDWNKYREEVKIIHNMLQNKEGIGHEYSGWIEWPENYDKEEVKRIKECAKKIRKSCDIFLVCGVGGSYLGARAGMEMIRGHYDDDNIEIIFVGNTFSSTELVRLLRHCEGKEVSCNVISKSGKTTETSLAFRIIRQYIEKKYGLEKSADHIFVTTDREQGLLRPLVNQNNYESFIIPDSIGGRFSVITPVGLLPLAAAGVDIDQFIQGAIDASVKYNNGDLLENDAYKYAVLRNIYLIRGYYSEVFASYEPHLAFVGEWLKQLFGESEGKDGKGLLPHAVTNSTDLHSMGQFIQQGTKCLFESIINVDKPIEDMLFPEDTSNFDKMNYLNGKSINWINKQAYLGTLKAHVETGGVPNIVINVPDCTAYSFGYLVYFYFRVLAMSAYILGVNPFDQPGVEIYKENMYNLLGKPKE